MKIGTKVVSKTYTEKGNGIIIGISDIFEEKFYEIQYADKIVITVPEVDISPVPLVSQLLIESKFSSKELFICRYLLSKIDCMLTENELISSVNFKIQPLPHQLLAIDFVLNRYKPRCLIADEVGLGKTIEAILIYEELKLRGLANKVLIIVPSGLMLQWQEELRLKFDEHFVIYDSNYIKSLKSTYGEDCNVWDYHHQIIASVDTIKPYKVKADLSVQDKKRREWHNDEIFEKIKEAQFDLVFFDEAHKLTKRYDGATTGRYRLGKRLSEVIPIVILLTATPHQGDEYLFLNLLKLLDPVTFVDTGSLTPENVANITVRNKKRAVVDFEGNRLFKHRITSLVEINRDPEKNKDELLLYKAVTTYIEKAYNLAKRKNDNTLTLLLILYQRIASSSSFAVLNTLKRRLYYLTNSDSMDEVEDDLSGLFDEEKLLQLRIWDNDDELKSEEEFINECISIAERITKSYGDKKFKKLLEIIEEIKKREKDPALKFIIFTEFKATQSAIIEFLKTYGYQASYINGDLTIQQKVEQIETFREKTQLLVSTDAGGEGINLQFCYCLINFDLPWNPTRLEQRIGRVDRIGQNKNVLIFNFQLTNTIDDFVRKTLEVKLELIKKQFGEDKYNDVISLLQDEFSFEKLYIDALLIKDQEEKLLDDYATDIYNRAVEILEKDDMILPFSKFSKTPESLLDKKSNQIIELLVSLFLVEKRIDKNEYKQKSGVYFFDSPFKDKHRYINIVFENTKACNSEKYEFLNVNHPIIDNIRKEISSTQGLVSSLRISSDKFKGIEGYLFYYQFEVKNNLEKNYKAIISVFLQDGYNYNRRISIYLQDIEFLQVENYPVDIEHEESYEKIIEDAKIIASEKAMEIFYAKKEEWLNQIDNYEEKAKIYYEYNLKIAEDIYIDNIRNAKIKNIELNYKNEKLTFSKKRLIVPKLEIAQISKIKFV